MSNSYSLDDLKADLDNEFAPLELEVGGEKLILRNMMRLDDRERDAVFAALKVVQDSDESDDLEATSKMAGAIKTILLNVPDNGKGPKLEAAVGGDLALGLRVLKLWTEATQPGEASNSPA